MEERGRDRVPPTGIPPPGRPVQIRAIEFWRVANGQLVETWRAVDALGLLQQLGVVPGEGAAAAPGKPEAMAATPSP